MERWELYNNNREKVNIIMKKDEEQPDGYYRLVVHVCIFNSKGEMLIQQRQNFKKSWPNMWDLTIGGSAIIGDTSSMAAERELKEELSISVSFKNITPSLTINFEKGFDDIYLIEKDVNISKLKLQYEEVKNVKWANKNEIMRMINKGTFIPYHKGLVDLLFYLRNHTGAVIKDELNI